MKNNIKKRVLPIVMLLLSACSQIEQRQALLEQARTEYRARQLSIATTSSQEKFDKWQKAMESVAYVEFYRTEETLGPVVPMVQPVKVRGAELKELMSILQQAKPAPLPDADVLTRPGTEPLGLNEEGEVVPKLTEPDIEPLPPVFFALDRIRFCDAKGNEVYPDLDLFGDIAPLSKAEKKRNEWTSSDRPFLILPDAEFRRFRNLKAYRTFISRLKKAHSTGKWDITPDFDNL